MPGFVAGSYLNPDGSEAMPTYEDVDSEEEAFNQLVLTVDTQRRDELISFLPRHLRELPEPEEDAPIPHLDYASTSTSPALISPGAGASGSGIEGSTPFGGMASIGAAAAAAAALGFGAACVAAASTSTAAAAAALAATAPSAVAVDAPAAAAAATPAAGAAPAAAGVATPTAIPPSAPAAAGAPAAAPPAAAAVPPPASPPPPSAAASAPPAAIPAPAPSLKRPLDPQQQQAEGAERRQQPRVLVGRLRVGRGGRVLIDRGGRGSGPRYGKTIWRNIGPGGRLVPCIGPTAEAAASGASGAGAPQRSAGDGGSGSSSNGLAAAGRGAPAPDASGLSVGEQALIQILQSGRICKPHLLETHLDPDAAWKRNQPLPIKQGPLLFDFKGLPKPVTVPSKAELAAAEAEVGADRKRKATEEPTANGSSR